MMDDIYEDEEIDVESDLQSLLQQSDAGKRSRPRYYCAGTKRTCEETGKKICSYRAPTRWYGPCPGCGVFFSCLRVKQGKSAASRKTLGKATMDAHKGMEYHSTRIPEFDRVLGGGVVYGKVYMLGAIRGCGKTTLLLQACNGFAQEGKRAYFASGEMDGETNVDYAKRLGIENDGITLFCNPQGIDVDDLLEDVLQTNSRLVVVDSLQLCVVAEEKKADIGTPTMVDAAINLLSSFAMMKKRAIIVISHMTKAEDFAGTGKAQHLVDALIRLESRYAGRAGDGKWVDTMIREISLDGKSRQGRSDVTALVELTDQGIRPPSVQALRKLQGGLVV